MLWEYYTERVDLNFLSCGLVLLTGIPNYDLTLILATTQSSLIHIQIISYMYPHLPTIRFWGGLSTYVGYHLSICTNC